MKDELTPGHDVFLTQMIHSSGINLLRSSCSVEIWQGAARGEANGLASEEDLMAAARRSKMLLTTFVDEITAKILKASPHLLGVVNYAVGYNNIDVESATVLGIPVTNTPGILTEATADLTWALILAVARRIPQADQYVRRGDFKIWSADLFLGADVGLGPRHQPKTLGIVGFGRIGQAVACRAQGFGMKVIVHNPSGLKQSPYDVQFLSFAEVVAQSDFLTLHCPLNAQTRHLISGKELSLMKKTAYLINTARGPIVDETALVKALREGEIAGAGLDVYEDEPNLTPGLTELENVVVLPHVGSASTETRAKMAVMAAENALALMQGKQAPNTVNPEVYTTQAYLKKIRSID